MRLYKRGTTWWVDLRAEGRGRVSTGHTDKRKAGAAVKRLLRGDDRGYTLSQAISRAMAEHFAHLKGRRTYDSIARRLLAAPLAAVKLDDLSTPVLSRWKTDALASGITGATVNRYLSLIGKTLRLACEWGWIERVPEMPRCAEGKHRIRVVTPHEEHWARQLLFASVKYHWMFSLVIFLLHTGARLGEALSISEVDQRRALETRKWTIWVNKADRPRTIPLNPSALVALNAWGWRGKTAHQCQDAWEWVRQKMGLEEDKQFVIHALRHTCATRLIEAGVHPVEVKDYLGHANIATTMRYTHLNPERLRGCADVLDGVPSGAAEVPSGS